MRNFFYETKFQMVIVKAKYFSQTNEFIDGQL